MKGHGQASLEASLGASLGADVQCTKLLFSLKIILFVGMKGFERWFFGGRGSFPSRRVSLQIVYPGKDTSIFTEDLKIFPIKIGAIALATVAGHETSETPLK